MDINAFAMLDIQLAAEKNRSAQLAAQLANAESCWGANAQLMATQYEQLRKCRELLIEVETMLAVHVATQEHICSLRMRRLSDDVTAMIAALPNLEGQS